MDRAGARRAMRAAIEGHSRSGGRNRGPRTSVGGLRATHTLADVLRDIKKASSNWVHDSVGKRIFQWQEGYGAFTVSAPMRATVVRYIRNQERHHRKLSFQDEYRDFLRKSGMAFKEEHLW
ncbi:MAG: transposase [Planctomycetes bacterium]|nr:transposase [Planctomycetota bacterium]